MNISIRNELPTEWKHKKPLQIYETRLLYTGFRRYDVERKMMSEIIYDGMGNTFYKEFPFSDTTFSRGYSTELVRVSIYSESPRIWVEEISPYEIYVFVEK